MRDHTGCLRIGPPAFPHCMNVIADIDCDITVKLKLLMNKVDELQSWRSMHLASSPKMNCNF